MKAISVNMIAPAKLTRAFGERMVKKGKGAVVLLSSLAGLQGSAYLAMYSASKAFNRTFAEALWYEWKNKGVDVIACIAGATATPGYLNSKPKSVGMFAPRVLEPKEVVQECLRKLGKVPSFITGSANRFASFFISKLFSRRQAVTIMGDTLRRIYSVED
jgi:short-subunit dehydrogenase